MSLFKRMHYSLSIFRASSFLECYKGIPIPLFFLGHSCSLGYQTTLIYFSPSPFLQFLRSSIFIEIFNSFPFLRVFLDQQRSFNSFGDTLSNGLLRRLPLPQYSRASPSSSLLIIAAFVGIGHPTWQTFFVAWPHGRVCLWHALSMSLISDYPFLMFIYNILLPLAF